MACDLPEVLDNILQFKKKFFLIKKLTLQEQKVTSKNNFKAIFGVGLVFFLVGLWFRGGVFLVWVAAAGLFFFKEFYNRKLF